MNGKNQKEPTCEDRINGELLGRIEDFEALLKAGEGGTEELGTLEELGLCLDYVEPDTFKDQAEGYVRYQLSFGGPSDEFRFYVDIDRHPYKVDYVFMDWFDGATRRLSDHDLSVIMMVWEYLYMESVLDQRDKS